LKLKIEIPANRCDLLSTELIADALVRFENPARALALRPKHACAPRITLTVEAAAADVRPYCVAAAFRGVAFSPPALRSFIELQDKLNFNIGRRRRLVAIGTHDMDKLQTPLVYTALDRRDGFRFVPLAQTAEVNGEGMLEALQDSYLKPYLDLIAQKPKFPVVLDGRARVCSVPPIVNADFCKLTQETTSVFVEITGSDYYKMLTVLDVISCFFVSLTGRADVTEPVRVD
uniref:phenylalanine--tRNA ligase n=1 Tax=Dermatophagoides pteronyssinus TaxID=6956 RepID=A0A6P6Y7F7_DERPT